MLYIRVKPVVRAPQTDCFKFLKHIAGMNMQWHRLNKIVNPIRILMLQITQY